MGIDLSDDICCLCDEHGITTIEVMHTMGYCKVMRGWEGREVSKLPKAIFCYDDETEFTYSSFCKQIEIKKVDHPFLTKFKTSSIHRDEYRNLFGLSNVRKEYHSKKGKISILYCAQWGYNGEIEDLEGILENGIYPNFLPDVIYKTRDFINWHFRLHPVQITARHLEAHLSVINDLARDFENVCWRDASFDPLPEVLQNIDGVLTMTSQAIYDAAYFRVKSATMCPSTLPDGRFATLGDSLIKLGLLTRLQLEEASVLDWLTMISHRDQLPNDWKQEFDCIPRATKIYL